MHELSIIQGLIEHVKEAVGKEGTCCRVCKVRIEIGEMSGVVKESLEFAFEVCSAGTVLDGAEFVVDVIPVKLRCRNCEKEFMVSDCCFFCPECGGSDIEKLSGFELRVSDIEVEECGG